MLAIPKPKAANRKLITSHLAKLGRGSVKTIYLIHVATNPAIAVASGLLMNQLSTPDNIKNVPIESKVAVESLRHS